jgi:hypothetical protein
LLQQHHQLIGGMIGNNQQAPPGNQGYMGQYKVSQAQMMALNSAPPKQTLSQQRGKNPAHSSSQPGLIPSNQNSANQQSRVVVYEKLKKKMTGAPRT